MIIDQLIWLVFNTHLLVYLFCFIGALATLAWIWDNFSSLLNITKTVLTPWFFPNDEFTLAEKYGTWAVVTGATDGIGREYAKGLAQQKINVVVVSRTESKLRDLCNELELEHRVKTKYIVADFGQGKPVYAQIEKEIQGIPVGILVNNVGKMYDCPDDIQNIPEETLWEILNINVGACTILTRMVVPGMIDRKRGAIVNISSGSELQPTPYMATYAATKAYVRNFTLAIQEELEGYGIVVQLVSPMFLITKMNAFSKKVMSGGLFIPNAESYTKSTLFTLGKTSQTNGWWSHSVQYAFMKMVPERVRIKVGAKMNRDFRIEYLENQKNLKGM